MVDIMEAYLGRSASCLLLLYDIGVCWPLLYINLHRWCNFFTCKGSQGVSNEI